MSSFEVDQIQEVLDTHFQFSHEIIIRGRDRSWVYEGNGMKDGKQPFMASAVEEILTKNPDMSITKNTTLLVDDDPTNIKLALKDRVRGILFDPKRSSNLYSQIMRMR